MPVAYRPRQHSDHRACMAKPVRPRRPALRPLAAAVSALLLGGALQAQAQSFPPVLQLSDLDGTNGFKLDGEAAGDRSARSISAAGDINGDGIDDLIVGAFADANGTNSGRSYVVFGKTTGFSSPLPLSTLDGTNGFLLDGEAAGDYSGISVSAAGDINGDGIDDLIVGASSADPSGNSSGRSYVVFGKTTGFSSPLPLSTLDDSNGFMLDGEAPYDLSGRSVSAAGDINSDGIDDLIVGAPRANANGTDSGRSYVVFGKTTGFSSPLLLSSLDGNNGFMLDGEAEDDYSGFSVSAAGDINGDGIDDLIVGAVLANDNGTNSGRSYVVFGKTTEFASPLPLSSLDGSNGFMLDGEMAFDQSGFSVSAAGDINGDGIDDLIVGAPGADPNGDLSGRSYVVFGTTTGFSSPLPLPLSSLDGTNGFKLDGEAAVDYSGASVSAAGDINGDGVDDLIIGALGADPNGSDSGRGYVVFGKTTGFASPQPLSSLDGTNGFLLDGEAVGDYSGAAVSAAGDINGDGVDDFIVGAVLSDANGSDSGRSYVIFGRASMSDLAITKTNGVGFVSPNAPVTYFIDVVNAGAVEVLGATLTDNLPATLDAGTASWTCTGSAGAVCPKASGSGNISETIDLPVGGMLSFELTATVVATEGMTVTNTATVTLPSGLTDINPANNSASDTDPVGLFADGFEDP